MELEFDHSKAPPPRLIVKLDSLDLELLARGESLESKYQAGWGFILEVKLKSP